jgi:DNA mismatch endonuclease (patch repair protein)
MRANRRANTGPERRLRSALHQSGLRFRALVRVPVDRGVQVDIVFPRARLAVFVDGCYWHACPTHFRMPATNREYWAQKVARNQERDQRDDARLRECGWSVLRIWEHEALDDAVARVAAAKAARLVPS